MTHQSLMGTIVQRGMSTPPRDQGGNASQPPWGFHGGLRNGRVRPGLTMLPALSLFLYTHRRMAITGDDVSLDQIVPVSRDFTLEEGATVGGMG